MHTFVWGELIMDVRLTTGATIAVCLALVAGCSKSATEPTGVGSVTAPRLVQPAPGSTVRNVDQPVTLAVTNAVVTQPSTTTYTFEVASDSAFANRVQTKSGVAEGPNGQTSVRLDPLPPGNEYYWRARASGAGTEGVFGPTYRFTLGPQVLLSAPTLVSPANGGQTDGRPTFVVSNAQKTGPAGPVTYRFEVSTSPGFSPLVVDQSVPEGSGRTSFRPARDLPIETTLYWRVTANDATNGVTSPSSSVVSIVTALAIDLTKAEFLASPNVSGWAETGVLELVEQDGAPPGPLCMRFTDPGWPDAPFFGDPNFGVYANMWFFARINGTWYGGAGEWLYRGSGSCKAGQGTRTMGPDSGFGPPVSTWAPRVGELVGWMVTTAARRGHRTIDQRTNIIVQPWCDTSLGSRFGCPHNGITVAEGGAR